MDALAWIEANIAPLRLAAGAATLVVWVAYLQLFLTSLRRQRRTQIMINRGVGVGLDARCLIANLGHEPIYVMEIIARIETGEDVHEAVVTDRADLRDEELNDPSEAAHQGPVKSGEGYDAGSFGDMIAKVRRIAALDPELALSRDARLRRGGGARRPRSAPRRPAGAPDPLDPRPPAAPPPASA